MKPVAVLLLPKEHEYNKLNNKQITSRINRTFNTFYEDSTRVQGTTGDYTLDGTAHMPHYVGLPGMNVVIETTSRDEAYKYFLKDELIAKIYLRDLYED